MQPHHAYEHEALYEIDQLVPQQILLLLLLLLLRVILVPVRKQPLHQALLTAYATERGPKVTAPAQMGRSIFALTGFWQEKVVAEVTPQNCINYAEKRGRAPGTVRRELGVLQAAINWAHKNGRLTRSVAVQLPEGAQPRDRWLTRQEAARLIRASRTQKARLYMPLFILIGLYTGRRKEAILSLRWPQVDLVVKI